MLNRKQVLMKDRVYWRGRRTQDVILSAIALITLSPVMLLIGILLARSVAGVLSGLGGWSTVYKVAAVLMVVMAVALWRSLPSDSADRPKAS